jgi:hypothetical protein
MKIWNRFKGFLINVTASKSKEALAFGGVLALAMVLALAGLKPWGRRGPVGTKAPSRQPLRATISFRTKPVTLSTPGSRVGYNIEWSLGMVFPTGRKLDPLNLVPPFSEANL